MKKNSLLIIFFQLLLFGAYAGGGKKWKDGPDTNSDNANYTIDTSSKKWKKESVKKYTDHVEELANLMLTNNKLIKNKNTVRSKIINIQALYSTIVKSDKSLVVKISKSKILFDDLRNKYSTFIVKKYYPEFENEKNKLNENIQSNNIAEAKINLNNLYALKTELCWDKNENITVSNEIDKFSEIIELYDEYQLKFRSIRYKNKEQLNNVLDEKEAEFTAEFTSMEYEFNKKQFSDSVNNAQNIKLEQLKHSQEISQQKTYTYGGVIGFLIMLLIAGMVMRQRNQIAKAKLRSEELLLNILPVEVAEELKATGTAKAKKFDMVTVLFTDFKNFTQTTELLNAEDLVAEMNNFYSAFDKIVAKHNIEKIKTIGDSYMCAGGLPTANTTNAIDCVKAAFEINDFITAFNIQQEKENKPHFKIRIGLHTGPVIAGIVGIHKFAYDIWGDTVNIASRMESSGEVGKINISNATYELVKKDFTCVHRGKIKAKNKGEIDMYFVEGRA